MPRVALLTVDGASLFELAGPLAVFDRAGHPWSVAVCSDERGPLRTTSGLHVGGQRSLRWVASADLVVVPTWPRPGDDPPAALIAALRRAHGRGATVVGLCLGTFVVAASGLLDGRQATTHWAHLDQLAALHPTVDVVRDRLYVDEGDVVTSAGSAAGIDCCLHLVRREVGAVEARRVARSLVVAPHRDGDQRQFGDPLSPKPAETRDLLAEVVAHAASEPASYPDVDRLAVAAAMSRRSFERHFGSRYGTSPKQWLIARRVDHARVLLESTDDDLERVAVRSGFGSAVTMRAAFHAALGTSPSAYRSRFAEIV